MKVRAFITHKLSERYSDCQDRFAIDEARRSVAVSDGMSQSIFPDYWASILSQFYVKNGHCTEDDRKSLCDKWLIRVQEYLDNEIHAGRNPWRLQNSLDAHNGAGATICGVTFEKSNSWTGHVLGDSCIIEIDITDKDNPTIKGIHTSEDKAFDSYPDYYESFEEKPGRGIIKEIKGKLTTSNILLLVSDPFSEFLYKNKENSQDWIKRILSLNSHEEFCSLVDGWRREGLHNDDSTLCIIEYDSQKDLTVNQPDDIDELIKKENTGQVTNGGNACENAASNEETIPPTTNYIASGASNISTEETKNIEQNDSVEHPTEEANRAKQDKDSCDEFIKKFTTFINDKTKKLVENILRFPPSSVRNNIEEKRKIEERNFKTQDRFTKDIIDWVSNFPKQ